MRNKNYSEKWWMRNVRGSNGVVYGIINTGGRVWQDQRRFALQKLKDFGFGRNGLDGVIQEEANELVESLLNDDLNCVKVDGGGGRTVLIDSSFNTFIINVLWQIVASKRFDPASEACRLNSIFSQVKTAPSVLNCHPGK